MEAMSYITNRTCVRFQRRNLQQQNYIYITKGGGCSSEVGMRRTGMLRSRHVRLNFYVTITDNYIAGLKHI